MNVDTNVYIIDVTTKAKIFINGGSQAVRLPKSCRFPDEQKEVLVRRVGRKVILELPDEWGSDFLAALGAWDEPIARPKSRGRIEDPFA